MAQRQFRRTIVLGLAGIWVLFLGGLALWTANPVTLNRNQILAARASGAVLVAQVVSARSGTLKVEEVLSTVDGLPAEIAVGRDVAAVLPTDSALRDGERIVAPVIVGQAGEIVIAPAPTGDARVYPATPDVIDQIRRLIADR